VDSREDTVAEWISETCPQWSITVGDAMESKCLGRRRRIMILRVCVLPKTTIAIAAMMRARHPRANSWELEDYCDEE
jgi:hypothetical protein